ncbi:MAG: AraC family transcriptional regulator [Spongiibacteraceae bacterium]
MFKKLPMPSFKRQARKYYGNEACFAFITHGEYKVRDQTSLLDINPKTALLAKCTNYFYESPSYPNESGERGEAIGVFLYADIFQGLFNFDISKSNHSVDYNLMQVEVDRLLGHYRDSIDILLDSPELADELLIESKLREFVLLITKKVKAPSEIDFLASMFKPNFAKFEEVIHTHLYADLSLDELAKLCHMSLSTFKRKFNDAYSESPKKYITRLKIEKAIALLKTGNLRISDIVFQTGFESISTFNRAFKAQTGQSPSQFRN